MIEIIGFTLIGLIVGFIAGWVMCYRVNDVASYEDIETEEYFVYEDPVTGKEIEITGTIHMYIEYHDEVGQFFAYNADNHDYIAMGKTEEDLKLNILSRYPTKMFTVDQSNIDDVGL